MEGEGEGNVEGGGGGKGVEGRGRRGGREGEGERGGDVNKIKGNTLLSMYTN